MFREFLLQFNPIDIVVIGIVIYQVVKAWSGRLFDEIFGNIAHLFAVFSACHYYSALGTLILGWFDMPESRARGSAFVLIWAFVVMLFALIKKGWAVMLGVELKRDRLLLLRLALGLVKSTVIASLFLFCLAVFRWPALQEMLPHSTAAATIGPLAPRIYTVWTRVLVQRLFSAERVNDAVSRDWDRLSGKNAGGETGAEAP